MRDWTKPQRQSLAAIGILMFQLIRKALNFWLAAGAISLLRNKGKILPYLGYFIITMLFILFIRALLEYLFFKTFMCAGPIWFYIIKEAISITIGNSWPAVINPFFN